MTKKEYITNEEMWKFTINKVLDDNLKLRDMAKKMKEEEKNGNNN